MQVTRILYRDDAVTVETIEGVAVALSDEDRRLLMQLEELLAATRPDDAGDTITLTLSTGSGQRQELPPSVAAALRTLTALLARGDDVALVPVHKELTTHEAAALLNVSRPFLVKLLDEGIIPSTRVGTHRRVRLNDVLAYRQQRAETNTRRLDEMLSYAQQHGGYD